MERRHDEASEFPEPTDRAREDVIMSMTRKREACRTRGELRRLTEMGRALSRASPETYALSMWKLLDDPFCLFASLDAAAIEGELHRLGDRPPAGSFLLLGGDRQCQELYFRIGYPYYARHLTDWSHFCRYLGRNSWAWRHMLTTDMTDGLLLGMVEHIHAMPPSMRQRCMEEFLTESRDELTARLGERSYLLSSPGEFAAEHEGRLGRLPPDLLFRSGAAGHLRPGECPLPSRTGTILLVREGRALVRCDDTSGMETRQILYEDMEEGTRVLMWRDGVIALHDKDRTSPHPCPRESPPDAGMLRYPVFEYRDLVREQFMKRTGRLPEKGLGREQLLDAMWRMTPEEYSSLIEAEPDSQDAP